jgi:hypothetical protein
MKDVKMLVDIQKVIELIPSLVVQAQLEIKGEGTGAQRKKFVIDSLNAVVDIPFLTEPTEAAIIGFMVEAVVQGFKKVFGDKWIEKIESN